MISSLALLVSCILIFVEVLNPFAGICFLCFMFYLRPEVYIPVLSLYHVNLAAAAILFFASFIHRRDLREGGIMLLLLCYMGAGCLSWALNGFSHGSEARISFYTLAKCVVFSIIILNYIRTRTEFMLLVRLLVFLGFCNSVLSVLQRYLNLASGRGQLILNRSCGFQADPNELAAMLIVLLPLSYYLFMHARKRFSRLICFLVVCSLFAGILCTVSRSGLLGLLFVCGCLFLKNLKRAGTFLCICALFLFFFSFAINLYRGRDAVFETSLAGRKTLEASSRYRVDNLRWASMLFLYHPLFGVGPGGYIDSVRNELGVSENRHVVHNTLMQILVEHGLAGFLLFMLILAASFRAFHILNNVKDDFFSEAGWYLRTGFIGMIIVSMFINFQHTYIYWMMMIMPLLLVKISGRDGKCTDPTNSEEGIQLHTGF